ncbi:MAG: ATP-binding protein [Methanomassiliicoccales archaeon]|nr:ATP-binding protein [Methanomassiliicoccales archaeon]
MPLFNLNPKESLRELFGREKELEELIRLVKAKRWTAVLGPRMVGKTSLLRVAGTELKRAKMKVVYVNLWGAKGTNGLLRALARGLNDEKSILQKIEDAARRIEGVSVGTGGISISISKRPMTTVSDLLEAIGDQAGDCVIELDEVQELAAISGRLLKLLANIFNTHPNIVFVFTGSMFGLMKTLLEPESSSPLYGRSPAKLYIQPFTREITFKFLKKGFEEYNLAIKDELIGEAVERLDGIPGWLTLYGNNVAIRKLPHQKALEETVSEGIRIVRDELEHFLEGRDRRAYLAALKAAATPARWAEMKGAVEIAKASAVNDATIYRIIENLKAAMLVEEKENVYRISDPMLRTLLLTSQIT